MSRALRLETFSQDLSQDPAAAAATQALEARLKTAWDEGHAAGLRAGTEAAAQAHAEDQARLRQTLVEAMRDQVHNHLEVQAQILRDIGPFMLALVNHLTPRLAANALADHIAEAVSTALGTRPDPVPVIRCAPEAVDSLRAALADWEGLRLTPDPAITPLEAEVHWDDGFDSINISALLHQIDSSIDRLTGSDPANIDTQFEELSDAG